MCSAPRRGATTPPREHSRKKKQENLKKRHRTPFCPAIAAYCSTVHSRKCKELVSQRKRVEEVNEKKKRDIYIYVYTYIKM